MGKQQHGARARVNHRARLLLKHVLAECAVSHWPLLWSRVSLSFVAHCGVCPSCFQTLAPFTALCPKVGFFLFSCLDLLHFLNPKILVFYQFWKVISHYLLEYCISSFSFSNAMTRNVLASYILFLHVSVLLASWLLQSNLSTLMYSLTVHFKKIIFFIYKSCLVHF